MFFVKNVISQKKNWLNLIADNLLHKVNLNAITFLMVFKSVIYSLLVTHIKYVWLIEMSMAVAMKCEYILKVRISFQSQVFFVLLDRLLLL